MSKRIKQVFTSVDQVLHLWANQSQDRARCGNVFFEGTRVYSYGYHYLLGVIHAFKGKKVAIINSTRYSNTTSKHQWSAYYAVSHYDAVLRSSDPENIEKALLETQEGLIEELTDIFFKRNPSWNIKYTIKELKKNLDAFNKACDLLKYSKLKLKVPKDWFDLIKAKDKDSKLKADKRTALRNSPEYQAKKQALALKNAQKEVEAWRNGGPRTEVVRRLTPQLLRISGDQVVTSRGAMVPLNVVKRAWNNYNKSPSKLKDFADLGHFKIDGVLYDQTHHELVFKIGCHDILKSEVERLFNTSKAGLV